LSGKFFYTKFLIIGSINSTNGYLPISESLEKLFGVNGSGIYGSVFSVVNVSLIFVTLKGEAIVLIILSTVLSMLCLS